MAKKTDTKTPPAAAQTAPATTSDATNPDEKALADKLMQELKASGVDVAALAKQNEIPTQTAVSGETSAPVSASNETAAIPNAIPTSVISASQPASSLPETESTTPASMPASDNSGNSKKGFHFPHIGFKFGKKTVTEPAASPIPDTKTESTATPEAQQLTNEALMEMIDQRLSKISNDDFITLRLSKQGLLILIGIILVIIWVTPIFHSYNIPKLSIPKITIPQKITLPKLTIPFITKKTSTSPHPSIAPSIAPTPAPLTIRVRMGSNSLQASTAIKTLLAPLGAKTIDVVYDPQVNDKQLLVVTRDGQDQLRQQLTNLLAKNYNVASASATLTDDSDFSASILVGKNSALTVKKTK